ncbi:MAG: GNAT family N-acetyltransferase [Bacteroidales bacterium]|nr:GNAT family N-acetyltransferase [Bacteroidales bacterium]
MLTIRKAELHEASVLTEIAFAAKRHWKYPESYYEIWKDELTITQEYITSNIVYVAVFENIVVGFYSIVENKEAFWAGEVYVEKAFWLEHVFILPEYHKKGIGTELIKHTLNVMHDNAIPECLIFVDPFATGFYEKVGARFIRNSKSSIKGREIPVFALMNN